MRRHKPHVQVFGTLDLFGCAIHFVYFCFMPFNFYLLTRTHTHAIAHVQPVSGSFLLLSHSPLSVRFTASQSALFAFAACAPSIDLYQYPSTISLCNIPVEPIGSSNKSCIKNELNLFALIKITPTQTHTHTHTQLYPFAVCVGWQTAFVVIASACLSRYLWYMWYTRPANHWNTIKKQLAATLD